MNTSLKNIKVKITKQVIKSRKNKNIVNIDASTKIKPRFIDFDKILRPNGTFMNRKKVILMSNGCCVPTCTMCPFTNYNYYGCGNGSKNKISLIGQIKDILDDKKNGPHYDELALYNDGSFFAEAEIPMDDLREIAKLINKSDIKVLSVESLPQFITKEKLEEFSQILGENILLEVGIGLQSSNSIVREVCVNTSFSNEDFENAVKTLNDVGAKVKTYVLVKPPFLTEEEAIDDALNTLEYLNNLGEKYVTLCPTRISPNTLIHELSEKDLYSTVNLKSVVYILMNAPNEIRTRVACVNLGKVDFESITPTSCEKCNDQMVDFLIEYSSKNDLEKIPVCDCGEDLKGITRKTVDNNELLLRVENYID